MGQALSLRQGLLLDYLTFGWNVVGVIIVIAAAFAARSMALAGFGLDSLIEIFASVVVMWQLTRANLQRERPALRLIGIAFIACSRPGSVHYVPQVCVFPSGTLVNESLFVYTLVCNNCFIYLRNYCYYWRATR